MDASISNRTLDRVQPERSDLYPVLAAQIDQVRELSCGIYYGTCVARIKGGVGQTL